MRRLNAVLIFFFSFSLLAAKYTVIKSNSGQFLFGEFIEEYQDRWFWEDAGSCQKYILIFETNESFKMINTKDIKWSFSIESKFSKYQTFLKENKLSFKNSLVENASVITGNESYHKFEKMYGNFAWDIGVKNSLGHYFINEGQSNKDYLIFNSRVHAPLAGKVIGKVSGEIDNDADPSFQSNIAGKKSNYLTLQVHSQIYLSIAHFKKDSIVVNIGDDIAVGEVLGAVGNSGVSYVPHLHYTLYTYIAELERFVSIPGFKSAWHL